jgi:hypothetical protein
MIDVLMGYLQERELLARDKVKPFEDFLKAMMNSSRGGVSKLSFVPWEYGDVYASGLGEDKYFYPHGQFSSQSYQDTAPSAYGASNADVLNTFFVGSLHCSFSSFANDAASIGMFNTFYLAKNHRSSIAAVAPTFIRIAQHIDSPAVAATERAIVSERSFDSVMFSAFRINNQSDADTASATLDFTFLGVKISIR